ncbi:2186_t:CDS:2 [Scutellospora calospora]|uniref:2186_t:CDS:1 n=1 Tax=Scutellospora calospora TaxID=85575 RepID=A0ACA9K2S1_9GLOM|nr:2186_t:CDS:2 [Scutellospora calospora]
MADFSLPIPPKDDFHLMTLKDFQISDSLGSSIDLTNSINFGTSEPLTLNTNNSFPGAKRAGKISTAQPPANINSKASEVENESQKITHSDKTSTKPRWLNLGRLKSKKQTYEDTPIKTTTYANSNLNPATNTLNASITSTSSPASLKIDTMINDGNNNVRNFSNVKKFNIFQKFGYKKNQINENSNSAAEKHLTQPTGLSTMSTGKPESDKSNFGSPVERLNHSHSFTSDPSPAESPLEQPEKLASLTNPPKDLMASSYTLFPNEYLASTNRLSAETMETYNENVNVKNTDIVAPLRHPTDDIPKVASLTTRRSRIFDIFTSISSPRRESLSSRKSFANLRDQKTLAQESSVSKDQTFVNNHSHLRSKVDVENVDISFGKDFKRSTSVIQPTESTDGQDKGITSMSKSQALSPTLYSSSISSFSRSFNSEDPSAFRTFSDPQPSNFNETNFSKPDLPLEDVWDVLVNPQTTDKGHARLSNNRLSYIPENFFNKLYNIQELYLDRNTLRDLPEELLKLAKLEILDLSNNCISEFNPRLKFKRLKNLRRLNLDNNMLSDIVSICKLKKLRELRANNNLLVSLTTDISKLSKLRLLYLDNNQLTSLPDSISKLKSLCVLRLNNNNIESLPSAICSLRHLQVLELRANLLTQLPENIKELENLAKLDVSNNRLTSLPNDIVRCSKLTHLIACNNQLESIPSKIGQLGRLLTLNLRENLINNLPTDLGRLVNLTDLDLSYNELIVLPEDLGNLKKLTEIKLNNNPSLLAIPETLRKLSQIKKIHLQHCNLSSIPFEIGDAYSQLEYVNLSFNLFDAVPNLHGMYGTTVLNISNNRIDDLTEQIGQLESLRELYLVNNKLTHLPKSIGRLKNLEILDVSENMLVGLPFTIGDCKSLRELRLRGNSLENLPMTLGRLTNLDVFYIGQWPMTEFNITKDENHYENLKMSPYQHKIPLSVERTLLWRMHDSISKRLRDIDYNDGTSERSLSDESQDGGSHSSTPDTSTNYASPPIPRDDVILKMAVLKGVYDQIMKDMPNNDYDKELCGDDTAEFPDNVKKKKFSKLKDFKFLKISDNR